MDRDVPWKKLGALGTAWRLLSFSSPNPPSWDSYWKEQREYWGADRPDRSRVELYFGSANPESALLAKARKGFEDFSAYQKKWNGLCEIGDSVSVNSLDANVIALSTNWTGMIRDHSDLELWLREETTLLLRHMRFYVEIYSFGTVVIPPESIEAQMGERSGSSRIAHRKGLSHDRKETVMFNQQASTITIGDAMFEIAK